MLVQSCIIKCSLWVWLWNFKRRWFLLSHSLLFISRVLYFCFCSF